MKATRNLRPFAALAALLLAACGNNQQDAEPEANDTTADACVPQEVSGGALEISTGLTAETRVSGCGRPAEAGDEVEVHYTGWLYDETADNNRGAKFDSSLDRNSTFSFTLGAGRVIRGWEQGVSGMQAGEKRILTIAPDLAYGSRAVGGVIPANSTLVFEVDLISLSGPADASSDPAN